ncbi:MAG: 50S ribosomal protein L10 [Lentimicrobium sp.]|jgi:large subunit ribosomal protein L10|nr:50S ribosomal protein L10 [Lentimicrobium sp.]MDD2526402.1 50S ribosomal protein L10 [Lentimicrobiaceae bacterium]MDD4597366.1 50S ribosomal protein L10 [Lentimicrobiaceae bacterium]MDY0026345.1 50S ribosomal protein L10 [Lentimicrobium sp.]
MRKEEKNQLIDTLAEQLESSANIYITDISDLNVEVTGKLRRLCFKKDVKLIVVKNTLLRKAMEKSGKDFSGLYDVLKGATSIMLSEVNNGPAKLIKEFRKTSSKPLLKGAFVEEMSFLGDENLDTLVNIKSKNELIADIILALQSPAINVVSALQSGGHKLSGVLKTLSER